MIHIIYAIIIFIFISILIQCRSEGFSSITNSSGYCLSVEKTKDEDAPTTVDSSYNLIMTECGDNTNMWQMSPLGKGIESKYVRNYNTIQADNKCINNTSMYYCRNMVSEFWKLNASNQIENTTGQCLDVLNNKVQLLDCGQSIETWNIK